MKSYSVLEFERILKRNRWVYQRQKGSHKIYKKENEAKVAAIPCVKLSKMISNRLIKELSLII